MNLRRRLVALASVAAAAGLLIANPSPAPAAPDAYKAGPVAKGATIRGVCRMKPGEDGKLPERWKVKVFKDNDKGCGDPERDTERWIVGEGGALANCVVYIKSISAGKEWPESMTSDERTALIDQKGCRYIPHVQWIRPATQIVVGNEDQAQHNIHGYRNTLADTQFNFTSPAGKKVDDVEGAFLEKTGKYLVKCDIHPWMSAYVHVVDHPYYDVTSEVAVGDKKCGEFVLTDVPEGEWEIVAWHEGMEETPQVQDGKIAAYSYSQDVTLPAQKVKVSAGAAAPTELVFEFDAPKGGGK